MRLLLTATIFVLFSDKGFSQTTLISPTGDGGFETGSTFAANGWTTVNAATNTWQLGTAPAWFSGSRGAFLSNDAGTSWAYTNSAAQRSHFYRDIAFPAGETSITLTFDWRGNGNDGNWDNLLVYIANTTVTPTTAGPTNTNTTTTGWAGYTNGTTGYYLLQRNGTTVPTSTTVVTYTFTAAQGTYAAGNTRRLIFTWKNDGSGGTNPPASIDNISLVSSCNGPTATAATVITNNSASANWGTIAGATGYNVEYRVVGAPSWTSHPSNPIVGTTVSITSLTGNTNYEYRVTGTGGGCALPGNTITFTTLCDPTTAPFSDGWEAITTTGTTVYPPCWTEVGSGGFAGQNTAYVTGGGTSHDPRTGSDYVVCQWNQTNSFMFLPPMTLTGGVTYEFGTYYITDGLTGWTNVGLFYNTAPVAAGATQMGSLVTNPTNTSYLPLTAQFTPGSTGTYYFAVRVNATSAPWQMAFDDFSVQQLCSGAPSIGSGSSATPASICNSGTVNLNLGSGYTTGAGITIQWKESATGVDGTFTNISGATSATYTTAAITSDTYYKAFITCTGSGLSDSTAAHFVDVNTYAVPTITSDYSHFCGAGGTAHLKASASPDPGYTYTWTQVEGSGGVTVINPDSIDFAVTGVVGSIRSVRLTASYAGCSYDVYKSIGIYSSGTPNISVTPNDSLCVSGTVGINSGLSASNFSAVCSSWSGTLLTPPGGTTVLTTGGTAVIAPTGGLDDGYWAARNMGFNFNFFGTSYSTVSIGTNGTIVMGNAGSSAYSFTGGFPSLSNPANTIAVCAHDMVLGTGGGNFGYGNGIVRHWTEGYAPNRRFVVQFVNCATWYSTNSTDGVFSGEAIFYETTGIIDIRISQCTNPAATTGTFINDTRNKFIGLQNGTQTIGATAPNCSTNAANYWNGVSDNISSPQAWKFSPPADYTMTWTPSVDISGSNSGTNLFAVTSNTITTTTTFGVTALNQVNGCSTSDSFAVTVLSTPGLPTGVEGYGANLGAGSSANPAVFCSPQDVTAVADNPGAGSTIRWYDAATGGTLLGSGLSYVSTNVAADDTVWAEVFNGICSGARVALPMDFSAAPAVTINSLGPDLDLNCGVGPTYAMDYQATSGGTYVYTWTNDGNALTFVDNGSGSASITADETTASTVSAYNSTTGCATSAAKSLSIYAFPSVTPTAVSDTVCVGDSTLIQSGVTQGNFSVACITENLRVPSSPTVLATGGAAVVPLTGGSLDDGGWGGIPLGFSFNYFGNIYSTIAVGTNGVAQFGTVLGYGTANGQLGDYTFASWPSVNNPANAIAVIANDLYLPGSGTVRYWTEGVAPNRVFVLEYLNVEGFLADGNHHVQLHVFETIGIVEIHAFEATSVDAKSIALQNDIATIGAAAPRCNAPGQFWNSNTATIIAGFPWAWRFTPPVDYTFAWSPSGEISGSTTGADIMAVPTSGVPTTQTYSLTITDNVSGCVNAVPFTEDVEVIASPTAPTVTGQGSFSATPGVNTILICGDQTVTMSAAGGSAGWSAHYYDDAALTSEVFLASPYTATYTTGTLSATDSVWVTLDNGFCEGPAQLVEMQMQIADPISISNSSPVNCGAGSYTSNLVASSTRAYTYTWNASPLLSTTSGASTTASPVTQTTAFVVNGDDGFCYTSATTAVSVYDFPVVTPTSSVDSICPGGTAILYSNVDGTNFTVQGQGYSPQSQVSPTLLVFNGAELVPQDINTFGTIDDGGWFNIPIGFTYDFFGNNYTTCHISTNGNIQFGNTANFSTDFTPGVVPDVLVPNNYVAAVWSDLNLEEVGSSLRYWTTGIAPNRVFCVLWDCEFYPGANGTRVTAQAELYETTGNIEVHIQEVTNPSVFQNRVVGVEDLTGTIGAPAPGRTTIWETAAPEAWLFTPPHDYSFDWDADADITGSDILDTCVATPVALSGTVNYVVNVTDNQTTCTAAFNIPLIVSTAPPTASWTASPTLGTTGGVTTTHVITNNSTQLDGTTYAWSFSPATVTYVDGTSATDAEPHVTFNEPGLYSATLTINTCNGSDVLTRNNYFNITPEYCFGSFVNDGFICTGCQDDNINNVSIIDPSAVTIMANLATGCSGPTGYIEYAPVNGTTSCTLYQGSTYTISVATSGGFTEYYAAWIDVDNDGDFDDPLEFMGASSTSAVSTTFSIGVPSSNVVYGAHRMRVMCNYFGPIGSADYCVDDCYGEIEDYTVYIAPPIIPNDIPTFATNVAYSSNTNYPNCYPINGTTTSATNSPESSGSGADTWYRFVAQSTGVSITMTSSAIDDMIGLYYKDLSGAYILVAAENASAGTGDFERLNVGTLIPGTTYYVSTGAVNNLGGTGAFQLCIQHLMPSWCSYAIPVSGFGLCDAYKAQYRGTPAQGVTYTFNFTTVSGDDPGTSSLAGTNGLTTLSQPTLGLRYGGIYDVAVDVKYSLNPSAGAPEVIDVIGSTTMSTNCDSVTIRTQPLYEVKLSQRCPATLLRSNYLIGTPIAGNPNACGATAFIYSFTPIDACGGTATGVAYLDTTNTPTPYMPLGTLQMLPNMGAWRVQIAPMFSYGAGSFGPAQDIQVNNTAASTLAPENEINNNSEKTLTVSVDANIYPNPNNGEMVNLNVSGVESDNVFVRITDGIGREVYSNRFTVDGSLNTIVTFAQPLADGVYNVTFTVDGQVMTEQMIVTK